MKEEIVVHSVPSCFLRIAEGKNNKSSVGISDWHIHSEYEMVQVLSGMKTFYIQNEAIELYPGDIIFLGSKIPHKTVTVSGTENILLQFQTDWLFDVKDESIWIPESVGGNAPVYRVFRRAEIPTGELEQCLRAISREQNGQDRYFAHFIRAYMYRLLAILYRDGCLIDREEYLQNLSKLLPAMLYISEHYREHISLQDISKVLNFHSVYCSQLFGKLLGCSFVQYLNLLRLHKGKNLMETTEKSITEIAYEVGFSSVSYFIKTFKGVHGYSPRQYRAFCKQNTPGR